MIATILNDLLIICLEFMGGPETFLIIFSEAPREVLGTILHNLCVYGPVGDNAVLIAEVPSQCSTTMCGNLRNSRHSAWANREEETTRTRSFNDEWYGPF